MLDIIPIRIKNKILSYSKKEYDLYKNFSYSQEGEDLILKRLFEGKRNGFFVDIGAHHPFRFSNTFIFYHIGWRGINVDPNPNTKVMFDLSRPRDINLEVGVGEIKGLIQYYNFFEKALNTFSKERSIEYQNSNYELKNVIDVEVLPLSDILDDWIPKKMEIDFMSIDVEGFEINVLKSNNWDLYKPKVILIEMLGSSFDEMVNSEIYKFISSHGYQFVAKTVNTVFFKLK